MRHLLFVVVSAWVFVADCGRFTVLAAERAVSATVVKTKTVQCVLGRAMLVTRVSLKFTNNSKELVLIPRIWAAAGATITLGDRVAGSWSMVPSSSEDDVGRAYGVKPPSSTGSGLFLKLSPGESKFGEVSVEVVFEGLDPLPGEARMAVRIRPWPKRSLASAREVEAAWGGVLYDGRDDTFEFPIQLSNDERFCRGVL